MTIPRLSERLDCILYRRKLELDIEEIRPELNTLRNASHELRLSTKFKQILQVEKIVTILLMKTHTRPMGKAVLAVGNVLNDSTFRGGARGFQLDALLKVI